MKGIRTLGSMFALALTLLLASRASTALAVPLGSVSPNTQTASVSSKGCYSWKDVPSPSVSGQLFGVAAISHTDVWAVGYSAAYDSRPHGSLLNTAVIEHWNGTSWSVIPSPQPGNYRDDLNKVAAVSSNNVWAVGEYQNAQGGLQEPQKALIEHWDGKRWSVIANPQPGGSGNALFGITALAADDIWAMGATSSQSGSSRVLSEHWNGKQWSIVSTPDPGTYGNGLGSMSALSPSDIWAVGSFSNGKFGLSQTLTEHWDGKQWSVVPSPNIGALGDGLEGVTSVSDQDVWAAGYYAYQAPDGSEETGTMTDQWNGKQWSVITTPDPPGGDNQLHDVTSLASNEVWAVGTSVGGPIVMRWNGHQWIPGTDPGPSYRWLWSVAALSPHDLWSVGSIALKLLVMHYC